MAQLVKVLDVSDTQQNPGPDGILSVDEVINQLSDSFKTATATGQTQTNLDRINAADANGDGEFNPPGIDFSKPIADQNAIGLYIQNFNMGLGMFKPTLTTQLPTFIAAKISADSAGFVDHGVGPDVLNIIAKAIDVQLNEGGPLIPGTSAVFGNATIDFLKSFPDTGNGAGYAVQTGTNSPPIYLDFNSELIRASIGHASIAINKFVYIAGSIAFELGNTQTVNVAGGLASGSVQEITDLLSGLGINIPNNLQGALIPALGAKTAQMKFLTIGGANLNAFVGMDGPYWTDLNNNNAIDWAFDTSTLTDTKITAINNTNNAITVNSVVYHVGDVLPNDVVVTLKASDGTITVGGTQFGDINNNGLIDANETQELSTNAKGLAIDNFNFGLALMQNTNPLDFVKYFSLKATADQVHMVGIEGVKVNADNLLVEINQSTPTVYGLPLFPVVDFANTPQFKVNERQTLFNIFDTNGDKEISDSELAAALNYDPQLANPITTTDQLVQLLDVGGAPPGSGPDGILSVDEVLGQLNPNLDSATIQSIKNAPCRSHNQIS